MKQKYLIFFIVILISLIPTFVYSQSVMENLDCRCNYDSRLLIKVEKQLLRAYKNAVEAILYGREGRKLPQCVIDDEIKPNLAKILFIEYGCGGRYCSGTCGRGATIHPEIVGAAFLIICDPVSTIMNDPSGLCGCLEGLMVHEIIHATKSEYEEDAVDCSKILYPCALDPFGNETPDHRNRCCKK